MKATENEELEDTKVVYAPTQFYDACDDCDTLPEERWEEYREKLVEETKKVVEGRERVMIDKICSWCSSSRFLFQASGIAKRSSSGLFVMGDVLANRSETDEPKSIESKAMAMTFSKAPPDGTGNSYFFDTKKKNIVLYFVEKENRVFLLVTQVFVYLVLLI